MVTDAGATEFVAAQQNDHAAAGPRVIVGCRLRPWWPAAVGTAARGPAGRGGVREIIDFFQDENLVHACRRRGTEGTFESISGTEAEVTLAGVGIAVPLAAIYDRVLPAPEEASLR